MAQASKPYTFTAGTKILSAEVNGNDDTMYSVYNAHDVATGSVHGISALEGAVVGTDKEQMLTEKLLCIKDLSNNPTKGKVCYIDPATLNMEIAAPTTPNLDEYTLVIATGVDGYGAYLGQMDDLALTVVPARLFLGGGGSLVRTWPASGQWLVQCATMIASGSIKIQIGEIQAS